MSGRMAKMATRYDSIGLVQTAGFLLSVGMCEHG